MKRFSLNKFPAIKACLVTLIFALPFCVYLFASTKQQLESSLSEQLLEISSFAKKQLAQNNMDNSNEFMAEVSDHLTTFSAVDAIAVMTHQYKIIFNGADEQNSLHSFRAVNPKHLNHQAEHLLSSNKQKIFVTPILGKDEQLAGWLLMALNPAYLERAQNRLINTLVITCLAILLFFMIALWLYRRQFVQAVDKIAALAVKATPFQAEETGFKELDHLCNEIASLTQQLSQIEISMTEEIKQTTEDLRETLETIEIQNVELDIARKDAVLANRSKSEFLANMSHEVRTPLNGIIGFTNLLLKSELNHQQRDHLMTIQKSSEILLMIINDILDFSKIEAGKLLLDNQALNLREVIDEVIIMLAPTAHDKNLELVHLHYRDVPKTLVGDPLRIKQVVTNLINNAIKFTQQGEVVVRAMIDENDHIKIAISDTGVGLSKAQQHSIFKAFSQADASTARNFGGTGLGLTISKKLIEQMNGKIGFDSELGHGSTFWFTLPVTEPNSATSATPFETNNELRHLDVICYEASEPARFAIEHMLSEWHLNFSTFSDIQQLIQRAQKKTVTFAIGRLFDEWKTNRSSGNNTAGGANDADLKEHDSNESKAKNYVTVLCIDGREVFQQEKLELIKQLKQVNQKVLLVTPTLESYDAPSIKEASAHLVKPLTHDRLIHTLTELASADDTAPVAVQSKEDLTEAIKNKSVLVVDDNEINLNLMTALLKNAKVSAYAASDGYEAIELCKQEVFPLIFMDIQMPGMDGIQTMKRIRKIDKVYQESPIVALTAYALPEERENFLNQGFQHLLTKPVDEELLTDILTRYLYHADTVDDQATGAPEVNHQTSNEQSLEPNDSKPADTDALESKATQIIDFKESVHLSNGNAELAIDLMTKFIDALADQKQQIESFAEAKDFEKLENVVHKLHGACHYCGVPKLRAATLSSEHHLKVRRVNQAAEASEDTSAPEDASTRQEIENQISKLLSAIQEILDWYASTDEREWKNAILAI